MIKFRVVKRKNPKNEKVFFHPMMVRVQAVHTPKIIERIEKKCTLSSADVKAVLDALEFEIIDCLQEGYSVRLGDLGCFRPSLRSKGAETEEKAGPENIKGVHVVYTPSSRIRSSLSVKNNKVTFLKVEKK